MKILRSHSIHFDIDSRRGKAWTKLPGLLVWIVLPAVLSFQARAAVPDLTFGDSGAVITRLIGPGASNSMEAVALQADGKFVVGGSSLARFFADGSLDPSFGRGGSVDVPYRIRGVAVQNDGRIVIVGETREVVGAANLIVARFHPDGSADTGFGSSGSTVVDISGGRDQMNAIALEEDGDIVVAGCSSPGFSRNTAVVRFKPDGLLDEEFGNSGIVELDLASPNFDDCANDVLIEPDGAILTGGEAEVDRDDGSCTAQDFIVLRLNDQGAPDASFGDGGVVLLDRPCEQRLTALYRYADGRILAGGQGETQSSPGGFPDDFGDEDLFLVRLFPDGSLDTSLGSGSGLIFAELGDDEEIAELAVRADGRIVTIGEIQSPQRSPDPAAARFTDGGSLDPTFGAAGLATVPSPDTQERIQDGLLLADESLLAVGHRVRPQVGTDAFLAKLLADGSLDLSFGEQGISEVDLPEVLNAAAQAVIAEPDGKVVAVGTVVGDVALARYNVDGSLDSSFGDEGIVITDIEGRLDEGVAAVRLSDGRIAVAATSALANEERVAVLVYERDGSLDMMFGDGGISLVSAGVDQEARALLVDPNGELVVAGFARNNTADFLALRLLSSGQLDAGFGNGGFATVDFEEGVDIVNAVLRQPGGSIILLGQTRLGSSIDFALARLTPGGILDTSFGTNGRTKTDLFFDQNAITGGILAADGRIITTGYSERGTIVDRNFAVVAYDAEGNVLPTGGTANFLPLGDDGGNPAPPGTFIDLGASDEAFAIAEDSQGRFVIAGDSSSRIGVARVGPDLQPDSSFGNGGTLVANLGEGQSDARALAIDDLGRIVVAGNTLLPGETSFARGFAALRFLPESLPSDEILFRDGFESTGALQTLFLSID